jgi:hypothetical protein
MTMDVCGRPTECVIVKVKQVLLPCAGFPRVSIILNPGYQAHASKTNELDETVTVDRVWVPKMLEAHIKTLSPSDDLWDFTLKEFRAAFLQYLNAFSLDHLENSVYVLRHTGASLAIHEKRHSLQEVGAGGRWRCVASIRRYEKHPLLQESILKADPRALRYCQECERMLEDVVLRGASLPAPPASSSSSEQGAGELRRRSGSWASGSSPSTCAPDKD